MGGLPWSAPEDVVGAATDALYILAQTMYHPSRCGVVLVPVAEATARLIMYVCSSELSAARVSVFETSMPLDVPPVIMAPHPLLSDWMGEGDSTPRVFYAPNGHVSTSFVLAYEYEGGDVGVSSLLSQASTRLSSRIAIGIPVALAPTTESVCAAEPALREHIALLRKVADGREQSEAAAALRADVRKHRGTGR